MTAAGSPNECTFPAQLFTAADTSLFGQCQFTDVSQKELAFSDEVLAAAGARKDKLPIRNSVIQVREKGHPVGPGCVRKAAPVTPQQQPSGWQKGAARQLSINQLNRSMLLTTVAGT